MIDISMFKQGVRYNITLRNGHFYIVQELIIVNIEKNYLRFIDRMGNDVSVDATEIVSVRELR